MKLKNILSIIATFAVFVLAGCGKAEGPNHEENKHDSDMEVVISKEAVAQIKLESEEIKMKPFTGYVTIPAKVITNQDNEALIGSLVRGRVHKVTVTTGDYVKAGQILMTVEGLDIGEIKAGYLIAKAALEYTKGNYDRQRKLYEDKIGSQKSLEESRAEYEKALAEFKAEDKKIHSVGLNDEDLTSGKNEEEHISGTLQIKSPINGVVVERNVVTGQLVDETITAFRVINTASVWIDGQIYEKDIAKLKNNTSAKFITPSYDREEFHGKVIYIGEIIDEQTRTITVRGIFNNPIKKLKPQMFGELSLPVSAGTMALLVHEESIVRETTLQYVFVQRNDTVFEKRYVVTGTAAEGLIEIKEGVRAGERIVRKGAFYLKSEMKKEEIEGDEH